MTKNADNNANKNADNYTDKRTGIVYANVTNQPSTRPIQVQTHLDAFIPDSFLKTYFGNGKSI